jgi:hypothetical protein
MSVHDPEKLEAGLALIEAWQRSGQTIYVFCRDRKLTRSNFDHWRRILAAESHAAKSPSSSAFVPVRVVACQWPAGSTRRPA